MPTEYSGSSASYPATVTLPGDGEERDAASVGDGLSDLADRTAYLNAQHAAHVAAPTFAAIPTLSPAVTVTRIQPLAAMAGKSAAAIGHATSSFAWFDIDELAWDLDGSSGGVNPYFALTNVPDNSTLTVVRFFVRGKGCTVLPSTMPGFSVEYLNAAGTIVEPTPQTFRDPTAVAASFAAWHTVTLTLDSGVPINHSSAQVVPYARIDWNASGSVNLTKFLVGRIECDFSVTKVNP